MAGLGLGDLPLPVPTLDPELAPLSAEGKKRFETADDAVQEDRKRVQLVRRQARKRSNLISTKRAQRLAKRLASPRGRRTPASACYMHDMRRRITGAVWKLVQDEAYRASPATATLIPRGLEVRPRDLAKSSANDLMNRLRSQIKRAEATLTRTAGAVAKRRGWLIGGLHCEFDPTAAVYQFHYHVIASDHMIAVIDQMRKQRVYEHQPNDRVRNRIRMSRRPLDNLPAPLSYPWQLYWPARARGDGSDDEVGFNQLHRFKRRIGDPYHTQALLWLDQQRIEDTTLLINLSVGRDGLRPSDRTYTNGDLA